MHIKNIILKEADSSDIDRVNEMMFHSLSRWGYTKEELNKIMDFYKIDEEYLAKYRINLVYHSEIFFGFFNLVKNQDQENELDYFIIRNDLIGRGYGKSMWEACCNKARSLMVKELVIMSTPDAKGFYQKMGAQEVGSSKSKIRENVSLPILKFYL